MPTAQTHYNRESLKSQSAVSRVPVKMDSQATRPATGWELNRAPSGTIRLRNTNSQLHTAITHQRHQSTYCTNYAHEWRGENGPADYLQQ